MSPRRSSKGKHSSKSSSGSGSPKKKKKRESKSSSPPPPLTYTSTPEGYDDDDYVASGDEFSDAEAHGGSIDTKSLTDSIREHVIEGGLRYHAYHCGKYPFPNDEVEQDRDDMKHLLTVTVCDGRYFFAPVDDLLEQGAEVLDLGTGTGIWCTELADEFPNSSFLGMDLSPIQPDLVPPNVQFVVDDIEHENGWDYPENKFDYIHLRHTLHTIKDRKTLMDRAYRHLKPGGYLEIQEFHYSPHCDDDTLTPDKTYRLRDFLDHLRHGLHSLGSDMHAITHDDDNLRAAGFEHLRHKTFKCPIGVWPRSANLAYCGDLMKTVLLDGLVGLAKKPFGVGLGWNPLQIEMFLVEVRKAVQDQSFHAYFPIHSVYARKPLVTKKKGKK